ncbi:MAG: nucleoside deaminase [Actinobacteria bacterium]|uniref:tRNA-specific adenosine deaminase 2 n=1 Tax=freshwater metagenome TaxID=449393 RepID=A0A6J6UFZ4_9ZZZZ|nr:nucleoside deaminase [Actinomycetota bacterium]MSY49567.1 nucleoside deaminase [Actinomycetota bacterium]MTH92160.1 nucleoside deaminase [Actinomycetota bacterium]
MSDEELMQQALLVAHDALASGDVPVGAIIVNKDGKIIASGHNERELHKDPTAHAEIVALRRATQVLNSWRLEDHTLVVTLEPCAMCAGAIAQSRISTVVFGAWDEKAGAVGSVWDLLRDPRSLFSVEVRAGVLADQCAAVLKSFIQGVRKKD